MTSRKRSKAISTQRTDGVTETTDVRAAPTTLPAQNGSGNEMDSRELVLFRSLDTDNDQRVLLNDLMAINRGL